MQNVAIVGGGISGLSLAYYLKKFHPHVEVTLFEKNQRLGGCIGTHRVGEAFFEQGPRTFPYKRAEDLLALIDELSLDDHVIDSCPSSKKRYLCHDGGLEALPSSIFGAFFSPLTKGMFRAFWRDLFASHGPDDETICDFFTRHIGTHMTEQLIDPMVSGIYAGDIDQLSIVSTFPYFKEMERKHRTLVRGLVFRKKKKRPKMKRGLFTLRDGLQTLVDRLQESCLAKIHLGASVEALSYSPGDVTLQVDGQSHVFDRVYLTTPPEVTKHLLPDECLHYFSKVYSASVVTVNLVYRGKNMKKGFGCLAPTMEGEDFLGIIFDSDIFPEQSHDKDEVRLTVMIGGAHHSSVDLEDHQLETIAREAVHKYLKLDDPTHLAINRYPQSICQMRPGHASQMEMLKAMLEPSTMRLHATYTSGPSINARVAASRQLAKEANKISQVAKTQ